MKQQKQQKRRNDQNKRKDKAPEDLLPPPEPVLAPPIPIELVEQQPAGALLQPGQVDSNQQQNPNDSNNDSEIRQ